MTADWLQAEDGWELRILDEEGDCVLTYQCAPGDVAAMPDAGARIRADLIRRKILEPPQD